MSRYAISDIHGCVKTFRKMVEEVLQLKKDDQLFLLGDYIDRGPDSKGVLDEIIRLKKEGYTLRCLRGNHEEMLLESRQYNEEYNEIWLRNGGMETLQSFGVTNVQEIPYDYILLMKEMEFYIELDDYILVHAGFNFELGNIFADQQKMLWIRKYEVNPILTGNRVVVHGHTPSSLEVIKGAVAQARENFRIVIDNGCVYQSSRGNDFGQLCALNLDDLSLHLVKNQDTFQ